MKVEEIKGGKLSYVRKIFEYGSIKILINCSVFDYHEGSTRYSFKAFGLNGNINREIITDDIIEGAEAVEELLKRDIDDYVGLAWYELGKLAYLGYTI